MINLRNYWLRRDQWSNLNKSRMWDKAFREPLLTDVRANMPNTLSSAIGLAMIFDARILDNARTYHLLFIPHKHHVSKFWEQLPSRK